MNNIWLYITGSLATIWLMARSLIVSKIRLRSAEANTIIKLINDGGKKFVIHEELSLNNSIPRLFTALCKLDEFYFYISVEERFLRAGNKSVDIVMHIHIPRWKRKAFISHIIENSIRKEKIPIYLLHPWDHDRISEITIPDVISKPYMDYDEYKDIEDDVKKMVDGKITKTGSILYGLHGNGKSYLIRYLAMKYKLPIYIISFVPDRNNEDLIRMFKNVSNPSIVLFEDFDSYFDGKECVIKDMKITFDTILNILDGVFVSHEGIACFLTANDISRVDVTLKERPSRFRFVKEIKPPTSAIRQSILKDIDLVVATDGYSLDRVLSIKLKLDDGIKPERIKELQPESV